MRPKHSFFGRNAYRGKEKAIPIASINTKNSYYI